MKDLYELPSDDQWLQPIPLLDEEFDGEEDLNDPFEIDILHRLTTNH